MRTPPKLFIQNNYWNSPSADVSGSWHRLWIRKSVQEKHKVYICTIQNRRATKMFATVSFNQFVKQHNRKTLSPVLRALRYLGLYEDEWAEGAWEMWWCVQQSCNSPSDNHWTCTVLKRSSTLFLAPEEILLYHKILYQW